MKKSELGYYACYQYVIERNGDIIKTRKEGEKGCHTSVGDYNNTSIGIVFSGNMSLQQLSNQQLRSAYLLVKDIQKRQQIPDDHVLGHRDVAATSCPGALIPQNEWGYIQEHNNKYFN